VNAAHDTKFGIKFVNGWIAPDLRSARLPIAGYWSKSFSLFEGKQACFVRAREISW
jgi:hypothetical protein